MRIYDRHVWKKVRTIVLERDQHVCQIRGPGCTGKASHVDHILPLHQGGAPYDPSNLRAACVQCNLSRSHPVRTGAPAPPPRLEF